MPRSSTVATSAPDGLVQPPAGRRDRGGGGRRRSPAPACLPCRRRAASRRPPTSRSPSGTSAQSSCAGDRAVLRAREGDDGRFAVGPPLRPQRRPRRRFGEDAVRLGRGAGGGQQRAAARTTTATAAGFAGTARIPTAWRKPMRTRTASGSWTSAYPLRTLAHRGPGAQSTNDRVRDPRTGCPADPRSPSARGSSTSPRGLLIQRNDVLRARSSDRSSSCTPSAQQVHVVARAPPPRSSGPRSARRPGSPASPSPAPAAAPRAVPRARARRPPRDRFVRCPDGLDSRLSTAARPSDSTRSRHLPVPSPSAPEAIASCSPDSSSAARQLHRVGRGAPPRAPSCRDAGRGRPCRRSRPAPRSGSGSPAAAR